MSSGAISDTLGMLPAMKITEPYSPTARANDSEKPASIAGKIFLFSAYGNSPPHEPSGVLHAARMHPLIQFELIAPNTIDKSKPYIRLRDIRFDYRIHLSLDAVLWEEKPAIRANNAGLFRDSNDDWVATNLARGAGSTLRRLSMSEGVSRVAFPAVEKPLVLEVVSTALLRSNSFTEDFDFSWDNAHWWGARGPGKDMISSPGAFHAAHLHWHWGKAAGTRIFGDPGNPRFRSRVGDSWGPLVDPAIWRQTVRIAVIKNEPRLDPARGAAASSLSRQDWSSLFTSLRESPAEIYAGDDLVLWYSITVHGEFSPLGGYPKFLAKPGGTLFIHGLYFAHEAEREGRTIGTTKELHWPDGINDIRKAGKWVRAAGPVSP